MPGYPSQIDMSCNQRCLVKAWYKLDEQVGRGTVLCVQVLADRAGRDGRQPFRIIVSPYSSPPHDLSRRAQPPPDVVLAINVVGIQVRSYDAYTNLKSDSYSVLLTQAPSEETCTVFVGTVSKSRCRSSTHRAWQATLRGIAISPGNFLKYKPGAQTANEGARPYWTLQSTSCHLQSSSNNARSLYNFLSQGGNPEAENVVRNVLIDHGNVEGKALFQVGIFCHLPVAGISAARAMHFQWSKPCSYPPTADLTNQYPLHRLRCHLQLVFV